MITEIPPRMLKGKSPRKDNERFLVGHHHTGWLVLFLYPAPPSFSSFSSSPAFFWFLNFFFLSSFYLSLDSSLLPVVRFSISILSHLVSPHYFYTLDSSVSRFPPTSRPPIPRSSVYFHQLPPGIERASSL